MTIKDASWISVDAMCILPSRKKGWLGTLSVSVWYIWLGFHNDKLWPSIDQSYHLKKLFCIYWQGIAIVLGYDSARRDTINLKYWIHRLRYPPESARHHATNRTRYTKHGVLVNVLVWCTAPEVVLQPTNMWRGLECPRPCATMSTVNIHQG